MARRGLTRSSVIGAGIGGLTAALELAHHGADQVTLVRGAGRLCRRQDAPRDDRRRTDRRRARPSSPCAGSSRRCSRPSVGERLQDHLNHAPGGCPGPPCLERRHPVRSLGRSARKSRRPRSSLCRAAKMRAAFARPSPPAVARIYRGAWPGPSSRRSGRDRSTMIRRRSASDFGLAPRSGAGHLTLTGALKRHLQATRA